MEISLRVNTGNELFFFYISTVNININTNMTLAQFYALVDEKFPDNVSAKISSADIRDALKGIGYQLYNDVSEKSTGWTPITSIVADGERRVVKIVDWVGGDNAKPAINVYVGAAGFTAIIADAIDVRGDLGPTGWTPVYGIIDDGLRKVIKVTDWTGGEGVKPTINVYLGLDGYTANIAQAINIRGNPGATWSNSASIPVAGSGTDGDYHLQTTTGDIYSRTAGVWSLIGNVKGPAGTLTASGLPARTTPINRANDKVMLQRSDGVLEKANLYQLAGGFPLVTGNLVTNGNTEFGDLSNLSASDVTKLTLDLTQSPPAGGKGAFKYVGANGFLRTTDLIPVNLLRRHRLSVVARHGDSSGANYDAAARCFFGLSCYDSEGLEIMPPHWAKVNGTQTTLAAPLNTGQTTMTLTSSANWHNGSTAANRGFAWYPYTNGAGQLFPDYGYSRNISSQHNAYSLGNGGAWAQSGISGNVVTLRAPWPGPNLPSGTKVANVMEGSTFMYSSALNNALVPNAWTLYECYVQGINPGNSEDPANLMFRPGTAFIRPILLINYNNPASTTTFYLTMLDLRETGFDASTFLAGTNTFSGSNTFTGETIVKRITASGSAPTAATGSGAGSGGTVSIAAGSSDIAGTITLVIGSSPPSTQTIATITFSSAMPAAPRAIVISARNNQAGMSLARFFISAKTASTWTLSSTDVTLSAGTTYILDYIIIA